MDFEASEEELQLFLQTKISHKLLIRENKNLEVRRKEKEWKIAEKQIQSKLSDRKELLRSLISNLEKFQSNENDIISSEVITKTNIDNLLSERKKIDISTYTSHYDLNLDTLNQLIQNDSPISKNTIFSINYPNEVRTNHIKKQTKNEEEKQNVQTSISETRVKGFWREKVTPSASNSPSSSPKPKISLSPRVSNISPSRSPSFNPSSSLSSLPPPSSSLSNISSISLPPAHSPSTSPHNSKIENLQRMIEEETKVLKMDMERRDSLKEENLMAQKEFHSMKREIRKLNDEIIKLKKQLLKFSVDQNVQKVLANSFPSSIFPPKQLDSHSLKLLSFVKSGWITIEDVNHKLKSKYCTLSVFPKQMNFFDGVNENREQRVIDNVELRLDVSNVIKITDVHWVKTMKDNYFQLMDKNNKVILTICCEEDYKSWIYALSLIIFQPIMD